MRTFQERNVDRTIFETTALVPVRSGIRVRPRSLEGGAVELQVAPIVQESGPGGAIRETAAATRVVVQPGEAVLVATVQRAVQSDARDPFGGYGREQGKSESVLLLRVSRDN